MSEASEEFLALAQGYVGCGFASDAERFMALIATGETEALARAMCAMSTCGLFVRGLLLESGATDQRVVAPYQDGKVMSDIAAMAREAGALLSDLCSAEPGDLIMLSNPEHLFVLESLDGSTLNSIQGGEKDASGVQIIARVQRPVFGSGRSPLISGRPLELMFSTAALLARFAP